MLHRVVLLVSICISLSSSGFAADQSNQPYIDQLKKNLEKEGTQPSQPSSSGSYIDSVKKTLKPNGETNYIDQLKASDPERFQNENDKAKAKESTNTEPRKSYTESERAKLEPKEPGGAIKALQEGKSDLKPDIKGDIHWAFGLRYAVSMTRHLTANSATMGKGFDNIYGSNYAPDLSFFMEYQPIHHDWFGNFGIVGMGGVSVFKGNGQFATNVNNPAGGNFPATSQTQFRFFIVPVTLALDYRFNLFRLVRPYIMAGPTLIGYMQDRNDDGQTYKGFSKGLTVVAGLAISLNWLSSKDRWNLFANYSIKNAYLTIDYTRLYTLSGDVNFSIYGYVAGVTFEM